MSIWAWKSKPPPTAPHKHQVRREAQECGEGRAGAGDLLLKLPCGKGGQKTFSPLRYESEKRGSGGRE